MHWLRVTGVLLTVTLLQGTVLSAFEAWHTRPDLVLLVALYVAVREPLHGRRRWSAFWVGWAAGLMVDIYSAGSAQPFGTTALVFGLVAVAMNKLGANLFLDSVIAQVLVLGAACLAAHGALGIIMASSAGGAAFGGELGRAFRTACYSAVVAPLVFKGMHSLERFLGVRSRRSFGRV
jgi:rod shape-determining protein MreD